MAQPADRPQKILTVSEANALLPKIHPLLEQLQGLHHSIVQTNQQLTELTAKLSQGNGYPIRSLQDQAQQLTRHQVQLVDAFQSAFDQLEGLGCLLKNIETGLLDFCALREGELVYLCWKQGEPRVQFWHSLEEGYAGRRPLEEPTTGDEV